jgi:NAD(P)-dependent dehydrogenase (short-subunit alcohol dehydrogenase family)
MATSLFDLAGKTAVVVGGTSGIGKTIALGLADAGADVVVSGRRLSHVESTAAEIEARGRKSLRMAADVRQRESLVAFRDEVLRVFGKVDIVVNAAGITQKIPTMEMSEAEWTDVLDTNLTGTLRSCQVFGEKMLERGYGRLINIASIATHVSLFQVAAYNASKAGVGSLTKSLAVEWSKRGVLVNAIVPGVFRTELNAGLLDGTARGQELLLRTPLGRFGKTEELVGAAIFLASDACTYVTGHLLAVDGGFLASGVNQ